MQHNADPNIQTKFGDAPLDIAIKRNFSNIIELLCDAGVHINPTKPIYYDSDDEFRNESEFIREMNINLNY